MTIAPSLVWLRNDLRLRDNPALRAAADRPAPTACLYILDDTLADDQALGGAQRWWLHHSLTALKAAVTEVGGTLILRRGDPKEIVPEIAQALGADAVYWNRRYMEWQIETDKAIKTDLVARGLSVESFSAALLNEPWAIQTKTGGPYRVYTPYWKQVQARDDVRMPVPAVTALTAPATAPPSDNVEDWRLLPTSPNWATGFDPIWTPGEDGGASQWQSFLGAHLKAYKDTRNRPDLNETSRLSPHLHFGEISIVDMWHGAQAGIAAGEIPADQGKTYLSELVWRDFSYLLTYHFPQMTTEPLMEKFSHFPWEDNPTALSAWQQGRTGYPIVDAGMRQLWQEGWMHNRVRMIVGSFLVKDLHLDWRDGMAWFWDTLVDADPASNTASWQWVAGCGADAAPFFRIFNPTTQGERFDPQGDYVRKYVPELKSLPDKYIHAPEKAPRHVLSDAGVTLGENYPLPIVDHSAARLDSLRRYEIVKAAS